MQRSPDNIYSLIIIAAAGMFTIVISLLFLFFRSRQRLLLERQIFHTNELEYQKVLLQSIIESQDQERIRIGRDLHDDVGTALANLHVLIETFYRNGYSESAFASLNISLKAIIDETINHVRDIAHNLSPEILSIYTTSEAIESLCQRFQHTLPVRFLIENGAAGELNGLNQSSALAVYRVLEELIANTIKHAYADEITLKTSCNASHLFIQYADNGIGISGNTEYKKGHGMKNIESRLAFLNASFHISKGTEKGFSILIAIPFKKSNAPVV